MKEILSSSMKEMDDTNAVQKMTEQANTKMKSIMDRLSDTKVKERLANKIAPQMQHKNCRNNDTGVIKERALGIYEAIFNREASNEKISEKRKAKLLGVI